MLKNRECSIRRFQFTPLREGRLSGSDGAPSPKEFQFTPLREGRQTLLVCNRITVEISIHAPPRGATDLIVCDDVVNLNISIHAPPRGATVTITCERRYPIISIHAPPRGATDITKGTIQARLISIHAPPRGATIENYDRIEVWEISIHAPPRGATTKHSKIRLQHTHFNSRPSARGDIGKPSGIDRALLFQFTPLREGRHEAGAAV